MAKQKSQVKVSYVDNPDISETFADSVRALSFDGQTMRLEFCTTRLNDPKPPNPPSAKQFPACRLVLTPSAAMDLFNKLQNIMSALEKSGAIKRALPSPKTVH